MSEMDKEQTPQKPSIKMLFGIRNYRLLWLGQIISDFGNNMTHLALLLLVNELTNSAAAIATMTIMITLPRLFFGLLSGIFVDRLNRKHIMIVSDLSRGLLVLGFIFVDSADKIWLLYLIGLLQGCVATFFDPARSALLPNLVPRNYLLSANSVSQTSQIIFGLLGTGAAGVLVGVFNNYGVIFGIDAFTFFVSMLLVSGIRYEFKPDPKREKLTPAVMFYQLKDGLQVTFGSPYLSGAILAISITMLGIGAVNILLVPLLVNILKVPETWFAGIEFAQTAAMVLSGAVIVGLAARLKPTRLLSLGLCGLGMGIALLSLVGNIYGVILVLFFTALFVPAINTSTQTIIQTFVADEIRGRASAARSMLVDTANLLSMGAAGILVDSIGVRTFFAIGGFFVLVAALVSNLVFRRAERREPVLQSG